jgi:hypothetical protein
MAATRSAGAIRFGDVAAGAGADHRDHVLGGVGDGDGEEPHLGEDAEHRLEHGATAAPGQVDVEEDHVRAGGDDALDGRVDISGLAHDVEVRAPRWVWPGVLVVLALALLPGIRGPRDHAVDPPPPPPAAPPASGAGGAAEGL